MPAKKIRVRVSWLSATVWLVRWADGLVVKFEKTKTGLIRVRGIYFSGNTLSMHATHARLCQEGFKFGSSIRPAKYCQGSHEYRLDARVKDLEALEAYILQNFAEKRMLQAPLKQFEQVGRHLVSVL